jgi:hypothetical protein
VAYTGVLLGNTAIPVWQQSREKLPYLFCASAMTATASLFEIMDLSRRERRLIGAFGTAGRMLELAATVAVERSVAAVEQIEQPLREGSSGALWKLAAGLTAASLVVSLLPGGAKKRKLAGVMGTLGSLALRWAIYRAGRASARDPHATFAQQRRGLGAAEVTGVPAVTGPEE